MRLEDAKEKMCPFCFNIPSPLRPCIAESWSYHVASEIGWIRKATHKSGEYNCIVEGCMAWVTEGLYKTKEGVSVNVGHCELIFKE